MGHGKHRAARPLAVAGIAATLVSGGGFATTQAFASAAAGAHTLCSGYSACDARGMTDHGYATHASVEHWNSATGHNCTNYAAYVVTSTGYELPKGVVLGNATLWASQAAAGGVKVDHTPTVGAVAQWVAGEHSSQYGHVGVVEKVTDKEIVVSADNYQGDFHWTVIPRSDAAFPTSFVHFTA